MKKADIFNLAAKGPYSKIGNKNDALEVVKAINYPKLMELIAQDMFAYPEAYSNYEKETFRIHYIYFLETGLIPKEIRD